MTRKRAWPRRCAMHEPSSRSNPGFLATSRLVEMKREGVHTPEDSQSRLNRTWRTRSSRAGFCHIEQARRSNERHEGRTQPLPPVRLPLPAITVLAVDPLAGGLPPANTVTYHSSSIIHHMLKQARCPTHGRSAVNGMNNPPLGNESARASIIANAKLARACFCCRI